LTKRFGLPVTNAVSPAKFNGPRRRVVLNTTGASGTRLVSRGRFNCCSSVLKG
jgi:hypothetical protein